MVPSVTALPDIVRSAFRLATSTRPGPVVIIVPHDVMDAPWDEAEVFVDKRCTHAPSMRYRPEDSDLQRAADLIGRAKRPAVIAGGGVHGSGAAALLTAFCDRVQPLHVSSLSGKGTVPETRAYAAGVLNPLGSAAAIQLIKEADLLIWCGSKASQNTAMNWTLPLEGQANISIDFDSSEHGRTYQPTVALCGDIRATLEVLNTLVTAKPKAEWLARIAQVKQAKQVELDRDMQNQQVPIVPPLVMAQIAQRLQVHDVVISDASFSAGWIAQYIPATQSGRHFLYARGQGGLGYASPAAIGAAAVLRKTGGRVVTVAGDGGHSFAVGELATLAQNKMRVVNIVINNGTLGWLQMWQQVFFEDLRKSVDLAIGDKPDFAAAATAMGLLGRRVSRPEELGEALDAAFAYDGPSLVEILIDPAATPIHSFQRRLADPNPKAPVRPGTVYELRPWKLATDLPDSSAQ
jgi:acetolactate synthase-1/2/3 large subunit